MVLATPEKWDFISRRWKTRKVLQSIRLLLVDDLHLLNSSMGSTLEVCLSRTRYISAQLQRPIRVVAIGNSLANAKDVGDWLGVSSTGTTKSSSWIYIVSSTPVPRTIRSVSYASDI